MIYFKRFKNVNLEQLLFSKTSSYEKDKFFQHCPYNPSCI